MKRKGNKLIFISRIKADGSGTEPLCDRLVDALQDDTFSLSCLSITHGTYIAHEHNSFIVKIKE
jgi:hypothetical protein